MNQPPADQRKLRLEDLGLAEGEILPGTRYRVIAPIARGGMGVILEAEHIGLKKRVVLKLLNELFRGREDLLDRMRVEAQALAVLNHPNIVQVSDFGSTDDGKAFLVMERLYGKTLGDELRGRGRLPAREAIAIALQILAGLGAAHEAGIIHRDIKVENVFLCQAGADGVELVKVLDFGAVKLVPSSANAAFRAPAPLAFPTEQGVAIGTARCFSPEQACGKRVDARSDIYAVGLLLYTLVTGRDPFADHVTTRDVLMAHIEIMPEPPSVFALDALPPELDRAIMKCLAKSPDDRFPTARALSAELSAIASRLDAATALPIKSRWESTVPMQPIEAAGRARLSPAPPPLAAVGLGTERIPTQAAMIDEQRRAAATKASLASHDDTLAADSMERALPDGIVTAPLPVATKLGGQPPPDDGSIEPVAVRHDARRVVLIALIVASALALVVVTAALILRIAR